MFISFLYSFFLSIWHKLETIGKLKPQLRNYSPSDWSVVESVGHFLVFLLMEADPGKGLTDCIIYLANMLGSNLVSRAPPLYLLQILPKDFCLEFLPKFSQWWTMVRKCKPKSLSSLLSFGWCLSTATKSKPEHSDSETMFFLINVAYLFHTSNSEQEIIA